MRVADELRGISASFSVAAKRSSIGFFLSAMIAFSFARLGAAFLVMRLRRLFFSIELFFAMLGSWFSAFERLLCVSLPEREIECGQQGARLVVGAGRGAYRDVQARHLHDVGIAELFRQLAADARVVFRAQARGVCGLSHRSLLPSVWQCVPFCHPHES